MEFVLISDCVLPNLPSKVEFIFFRCNLRVIFHVECTEGNHNFCRQISEPLNKRTKYGLGSASAEVSVFLISGSLCAPNDLDGSFNGSSLWPWGLAITTHVRSIFHPILATVCYCANYNTLLAFPSGILYLKNELLSVKLVNISGSNGASRDALPGAGQHFQRDHDQLAQGGRSQRAAGEAVLEDILV